MKNEKKAKKIIFCVCCIGNIFLLFGCAKTETASADNTVTEKSVINTTETITVEMPETVQVPSEQLADPPPEYKIIMVGDILLHTPVEESCLQPDGSYDYDSLFSHTKEEIAAADLALVNQEVIIGGADLGITCHIGTLVDHKNLFPSVSRFSCEHRSVQAGTNHQIIVFHKFYIFPFSQSHSCAYVISVQQPSLRRHVSEPPE